MSIEKAVLATRAAACLRTLATYAQFATAEGLPVQAFLVYLEIASLSFTIAQDHAHLLNDRAQQEQGKGHYMQTGKIPATFLDTLHTIQSR